ncbi:MAG TPA: hypothetical protein PLF27_12080, partial [Sedimentibacter sp.]|nr:hypothetical protein [Sedimentibacter sp.]
FCGGEGLMIKGHYLHKTLIAATVFIFLFSLCCTVYGVEFNDDIQKITLNYDYFDGIGNDKILRMISI